MPSPTPAPASPPAGEGTPDAGAADKAPAGAATQDPLEWLKQQQQQGKDRAQAVAEAQPLDAQIAFTQIQLFVDRHLVARFVQARPEKLGQVFNHRLRGIRIGGDE